MPCLIDIFRVGAVFSHLLPNLYRLFCVVQFAVHFNLTDDAEQSYHGSAQMPKLVLMNRYFLDLLTPLFGRNVHQQYSSARHQACRLQMSLHRCFAVRSAYRGIAGNSGSWKASQKARGYEAKT